MRRGAVLVCALLLWAGGGWFTTAQAARTVTVTVRTVPALAGARFAFDGQVAVTGADGVVRFSGTHDFAPHTLTVDDSQLTYKDRRFTFARWAGQRDPDQAFRRTVRGLPRRADYAVTAAFTGRFRTTVRCVDDRGRAVPAGRIPRVTLRADTGASARVPVGRPVWLDGLLPVYRKSVLTVRRLRYALVDASAYGANTVDAGRQRFVPARGADEVVFTTPFHDLSVSGRDAVFGSHAGRRVRVVLPDGSVRTAGFGADRTAVLRDLPHGRYDVEIIGAEGLGALQTVRLSRDQAVRVRVVSRADLLLAGGAVAVFAGGLLGVGRLLRRRKA
ncbi:hypothetical protein AB0J38_31300 [Streptomyces sp. NPDC050095]|uniref:hypothetical protein n=1 Tax=unclassified Streptomyces TaxID=2593676 RepID=UPI003418DB43